MSSRLFDALDERFNDFDECKDVQIHGMTGGFSGFIYTSEINEFFDEHKNEIEDYLYMILGDNLHQGSLQELLNCRQHHYSACLVRSRVLLH